MYIANGETYFIVLFILILSVICLAALIILFLYSLFFKKKRDETVPVQEAGAGPVIDRLNID